MTFRPIVPMAGYSGWVFLKRTMAPQQEAYLKSPQIKRDMDHFRENIGNVRTAEDLVKDRRLLSVTLEAFGLEGDLNSRAFIQKVLEEGTLKPDAFANRLADKRYASLALTFGFGDLGPRTNMTTFADTILSKFAQKSFARAVGETDNSMRMALNLEASLGDIVGSAKSESAQWFAMMGDPPVRKLFETALGLPSSLGRLDLDQQLTNFRDRARSAFGTDKIAELASPENREKLIRLFLIREQAQQSTFATGANVALSLLSSIARPA